MTHRGAAFFYVVEGGIQSGGITSNLTEISKAKMAGNKSRLLLVVVRSCFTRSKIGYGAPSPPPLPEVLLLLILPSRLYNNVTDDDDNDNVC